MTNKYISYIKELPPHIKKNTLYLFLTYFLILFTYPLTRSSTQVYLLESYGAHNLPLTWFLSIATLTLVIFFCNKVQNKIGVHRLFRLLSLFSILVFGLGLYFYKLGFKEMSIVMFIWKEVYIVVLIHLFLAFCNGLFSLSEIKFLYGPLGAMGSLGGIIGGQLTSLIAKSFGTDFIIYVSLLILLFSFLAFLRADNKDQKMIEEESSSQEKIPPLRAIRGVGYYVFLISVIVALSQFVINITDLQFNIIFEKVVTSKDERSFYLGQLYSLINVVTLIIQFFVLPIALQKVRSKDSHIFVPLFYLSLVVFGFGLGGAFLWPVATVFVAMKATDYSLFAVIKEILYHPLSNIQKYGAKYIADMFTYRIAKALIAILLMFVSNLVFLSSLQFLFIIIWVICVILIFRKYKTVGANDESNFTKE